jgi:hypothetical protein
MSNLARGTAVATAAGGQSDREQNSEGGECRYASRHG